MAFSNKSNKQLIHELQDDLNNINSSSASEISDVNGLQAELDSKQQKSGKLQIYDTVFGVNVISTDELTLGSQSGRINLTAHNIYYDIDEAGNYKKLQDEIDSKQQLITSTSELSLQQLNVSQTLHVDSIDFSGAYALKLNYRTIESVRRMYLKVTNGVNEESEIHLDAVSVFYNDSNNQSTLLNTTLDALQTQINNKQNALSLIAGDNITISENGDDITISATENITASNNLFRLGDNIQMIPGPILNSVTFTSDNSVPGIIFFDSNDDLLIDAGERSNTNAQPQVKIKRSLIVGESALIEGSLTVNNSIESQRHLALFSDIDQSMLLRLNPARSGDIEFTRNGSLQSLNTILDNINTGGGSSYTFNSPLNENNGIVTVDLSSKQDVLSAGSNIDITNNVISSTVDLSSKQDVLSAGSNISINSLLVGNIISSVNSGDIKTSGSIHTHNVFSTGSIVQNTSDNLHTMGLYYSSDGVSQDTNLNIIYPSYFINSGVYDDLNILNMMAFNNDSNSASRSVEIVTPLTVSNTLTLVDCEVDNNIDNPLTTDTHFDKCIELSRTTGYRNYYMGILGNNSTNDNKLAWGVDAGGGYDPNICMCLDGSGNLSVYGDITSTGDFVVNQSLRVDNYIRPHTNAYLKWLQGSGQSYHQWRFGWPSNNTYSRVYFQNLSGDINCTIHAAGFHNTSDDRNKDNEEPIINALHTINKIKPMNYQKYGNLEKTGEFVKESGVIVQQVYYEVDELKHLITYGEELDDKKIQDLPAGKQFDDLTDEDYEGLGWPAKTCTINYIQFIPWLIKGMQEQQTQINEILSKHNDTTITTFTRDNYLFKFIMPIGKIKIKKAIFEHTDITGAYKLKKLDGTLIGIFDGLKVIESHEFDSNGIVKFMLYDMNNNILPCESGSTDVLIIV